MRREFMPPVPMACMVCGHPALDEPQIVFKDRRPETVWLCALDAAIVEARKGWLS